MGNQDEESESTSLSSSEVKYEQESSKEEEQESTSTSPVSKLPAKLNGSIFERTNSSKKITLRLCDVFPQKKRAQNLPLINKILPVLPHLKPEDHLECQEVSLDPMKIGGKHFLEKEDVDEQMFWNEMVIGKVDDDDEPFFDPGLRGGWNDDFCGTGNYNLRDDDNAFYFNGTERHWGSYSIRLSY